MDYRNVVACANSYTNRCLYFRLVTGGNSDMNQPSLVACPNSNPKSNASYMPEKHRLFVRALEDKDHPNLSAFVLDLVEKEPELTEVERNIVEAYKGGERVVYLPLCFIDLGLSPKS